MILLDVPLQEESCVKVLGGSWIASQKKWAVKSKSNYHRFIPWLYNCNIFGSTNDGSLYIACDNIFIAESTKTCIQCKRKTRVIGAAYDRILHYDITLNGINKGFINIKKITDLNIMPLDVNTPDYVLNKIKTSHPFLINIQKGELFFNRCENCGVLLSDYDIYYDINSPFFITSAHDAKKITLHKIHLNFDFVLCSAGKWVFGSPLIRKHAKIINY